MKLVTFTHNNTTHIGALQGQAGQESVVDLNQADPQLPTDMIEFLKGGAATLQLAQKALAAATPEMILDRAAVTLHAPIPRPGKIICLGLNYRDHAEESNQPLPPYPVVFTKYANTVIATGEAIVLPKVTDQVDYEAEFGVVIGRTAKNVSEAEALDYVAGYVPFNDVSARDYQMRTSQWTIGKTFDTFGPMGPALTTADEIPDPHNLNISLRIGDEVLQSSNTSYLIFNVNHLIAYLSQVMTLEPGDLISTGTPGGVGAARQPQRFLRPGDVVSIEIEGLGTLTNPVVAEA